MESKPVIASCCAPSMASMASREQPVPRRTILLSSVSSQSHTASFWFLLVHDQHLFKKVIFFSKKSFINKNFSLKIQFNWNFPNTRASTSGLRRLWLLPASAFCIISDLAGCWGWPLLACMTNSLYLEAKVIVRQCNLNQPIKWQLLLDNTLCLRDPQRSLVNWNNMGWPEQLMWWCAKVWIEPI